MGEKNPLWQGGISFEPYGKEFSKPLSAKADSFSLPNPNKGGREVRVVYETPTTNVSRSDSISG